MHIIFYELLQLNSVSLTSTHFSNRRKLLETVISLKDSKFYRLSELSIFSLDDPLCLRNLQEYYLEILNRKEEGLMIKGGESVYKPGTTGKWFKLKRNQIAGLGDNADFTIVGVSMERESNFLNINHLLKVPPYFSFLQFNRFWVAVRIPRASSSVPHFKVIFYVEAGFSVGNRLDLTSSSPNHRT
jgi:DNA ligase-4